MIENQNLETMDSLPPMPEMENVQETAPVQEAAPSEKEINLRAIRQKAERAEKAERERDELLRKVQAYEANQHTAPQQEEDYSINIGESDLVEGKHLSKYDKKIEKKFKEYEARIQRQEQQLMATALTAQYPDYYKVVNADNIKALEEMHPEIANSLNSSADKYNTAISAYKLIKNLVIAQQDYYSPEKEMIQKNAHKPRPLASVAPQQGDSPLSHANAFANALTPELQKKLFQEMMEIRKQR